MSTELTTSDGASLVFDSMTPDQRLQTVAQMIGYKSLPPTIQEFINDDYYLGSVLRDGMYDFWKEKLYELFPTPITSEHTYILLTGAIGIGKSFFSRAIGLYNKCRLLHMKNLNYFGLTKGKNIQFVWFHESAGAAWDNFIGPNDVWERESPFFQAAYANPIDVPFEDVADGTRVNKGLGGDVMFYNMSELNFIPYWVAQDRMSNYFKRFKSRFESAMGFLGNVIIDTSARGDDSIVEDFLKSNPYNPWIIRGSTWLVKGGYPDREEYPNEWTQVYIGDSINEPFILKNGRTLTEKMDAERVIWVPNRLIPDFEFDIKGALQDQAGISTSSTGKYLGDTTAFKAACSIKNHIKEVITVDFYDRTDRIIEHIRPQLELIPRDRVIFVRFDIGVTGDLTGVAITHFDGMKKFRDDSKIELPSFRTPVKFAMSRNDGEETSITHMLDFVLELNDMFEIGSVSLDQFASRQLLQDMTRHGIRNKYLSVDRTDEAYLYFKNCFNNKLWTGVNHELFQEEICGLKHLGGKIDHPINGSKDIGDAVSGSVFDCYIELDIAQQISNYKATDHQVELYKELQGFTEQFMLDISKKLFQ